MGGFNGATLTEKGLLLQNKAQSGVELRMSRVAIGSGSYTGNLSALTALIKEEKILPIKSITLDNGKTKIRSTLDNSDVNTGFYIKEIGLYALDPDEGEILYAVANSGDGPADYIPPHNSDVVEEIIDLNTLVGNATNVTAVIDKSIVYPSYEDFEKMKKNYEAEVLNYKNIVQTALHSGCLDMGEVVFDHKESNKLKVKETKVYVNGDFITIPEQYIDCGDSPAADFVSARGRKGSRDDLIFLEVWKELGVDSSDIQTKHRIRVVEDVDFYKYHEGLGYTTASDYSCSAQGGNAVPTMNTTSTAQIWYSLDRRLASIKEGKKLALNDVGVYIAGMGGDLSKNVLMSHDGYVYAIPLFRVERRNNEGYSQDNPNGGRDHYQVRSTGITFVNGKGNITFTDDVPMKTGDIITINSLYRIKILSETGVKQYDVESVGTVLDFIWGGSNYYGLEGASTRPDAKFSNIVYAEDIIDLRHQVSLTGFDYEFLLQKSMQEALSGELAPVKMKKQYHGIKKTPTDANTVFYTSMDGTLEAEVGGLMPDLVDLEKYKMMPTGLGVIGDYTSSQSVPVGDVSEEGTYDIWVDRKTLLTSSSVNYLVGLFDEDNHPVLTIYLTSNKFKAFAYNTELQSATSFSLGDDTSVEDMLDDYVHVRLTWKLGETANIYVNGKLKESVPYTVKMMPVGYATIHRAGWYDNATPSNIKSIAGTVLNDIHISKVDRGDVFLTLPQDFIEGEAEIKPALTEQRQSYGEPMNGQVTTGIVKTIGKTSRGLTKTQATEGIWASEDTIKVKGEAGEVISGLIDADTALARVLKRIDTLNIVVDDVSQLSVNDEVTFHHPVSTDFNTIVTAIDVANKTITIAIAVGESVESYILIETTTSSSVPLVNFLDDDTTKTTVEGTWSGLGTNEAIFTLGVNANLTNEDIYIDYSLNTPEHEGQIPVYDEVLEGVVNGKKLVKSDKIVITDDFNGKIEGSTSENPNIVKAVGDNANSLLLPSLFTYELASLSYKQISTLDASLYACVANSDGNKPQHLFSFDIVRMVEDKYGEIPAVDKVAWLKANIEQINLWHSGKGNSPNGAEIFINSWNDTGNGWWYTSSHTNVAVEKIYVTLTKEASDKNPEQAIDSNGFVHMIAYTSASDGVTPSAIYTDYASIEVFLSMDTNFDILAPEDTRRDAGRSNVLLVRKETREIKTLFPSSNEDEVAVIGNVREAYEQLARADYYTVLSQQDLFIATDLNSANGDKYGLHHWNNLAWRFNADDQHVLGEFGYGEVPMAVDSKGVNEGFQLYLGTNGMGGHYVRQFSVPVLTKPMIGLNFSLVMKDSQLFLFVITHYEAQGLLELYNDAEHKGFLIPLKGRPLVKLNDGELLEATLSNPTAWKTPIGELQGFLDEEGKVITT